MEKDVNFTDILLDLCTTIVLLFDFAYIQNMLRPSFVSKIHGHQVLDISELQLDSTGHDIRSPTPAEWVENRFSTADG